MDDSMARKRNAPSSRTGLTVRCRDHPDKEVLAGGGYRRVNPSAKAVTYHSAASCGRRGSSAWRAIIERCIRRGLSESRASRLKCPLGGFKALALQVGPAL